jgi:putative DNA primase/helicase
MIDFNIYPEKPKFCVVGDARGTGSGKTTQLIDMMCFDMSKDPNYKVVLAVPTHRLGEDIAKRFTDRGFEARVFYGRDAIDPETPKQKMCKELERTKEINSALGDVARQACKNGSAECEFYKTCSYQAQQRLTPRVWIVAHNLLFRERPSFIPQPDFMGIDEAFWGASLNGFEKSKLVTVDDLEEVREVRTESKQSRNKVDFSATADLMSASQRMARLLREEMSGRIRKAVLDNFDAEELRIAYRLEWRRKIELDIKPDMPLATVAELCRQVADHNQQTKLLSEFWDLMLRTKLGGFDRSPFLDLQKAIRIDKGRKGSNQPTDDGVYLAWSDDIHSSWHANTWIMDATMNDKIVQRFYPQMPHSLVDIKRPSPHTRIRQITDRRISKASFVPNEKASPKDQRTQRNNLERVRRLLEVRSREVWPGKLLVICQLDLEMALINAGKVPQNVELQHFKNHSGENKWRDVPGLMTIGRTEPGVREVERIARALFGVDISEIEPDTRGVAMWPVADGRIMLRNGTSVAVESSRHPDPHVDEIRQQICEAELMQAIGRGRGDDRTEANPLQIDILTNVPLPLVADEALRWKEIQPSLAKVMWARGAVPVSYKDMASAYPDLFDSAEAARKALKRQNPGQTPIEYIFLIGVCPGFLSVAYRRPSSRGPAGRLLYDPERIDPTEWLAERLGATVTTEAVRRAPTPIGIPMVEVTVDGKVRRVIDFNGTVGKA